MDKIFISIPSYEDEELLNTILSAINMAKNPERLVFGLALQHKRIPEPDLSFIQDQCRVIRYDVDNRPGLTRIRSAIYKNLLSDEKYFLGIDAHTRFRKDWDDILIRDHEFLSSVSNTKIAIGERYDGNLEFLENDFSNINMYLTANWRFQKGHLPSIPHIDAHADVWEKVITNAGGVNDIVYKSSHFISCNYWFTTSDFVLNGFLPDFGQVSHEELQLSMALYCNGWDVYHPVNKHILTQSKSETNNRSNDIHWRTPVEKNWVFDDLELLKEVFKLLIIGECKYYSFKGKPRSVDQYWASLGYGREHQEIKSDIIKS